MLNSLVLEPYGHLIDYFGDQMSCDEAKLFPINGDMTVESVKSTIEAYYSCLLYTSPSPRDMRRSRMPSSA